MLKRILFALIIAGTLLEAKGGDTSGGNTPGSERLIHLTVWIVSSFSAHYAAKRGDVEKLNCRVPARRREAVGYILGLALVAIPQVNPSSISVLGELY